MPGDNMVQNGPNHIDIHEGEKARKTAAICAVIGLFFAGVVFGPIAIYKAREAEKLGVKASGWQILGWLDLVLWVIFIIARLG